VFQLKAIQEEEEFKISKGLIPNRSPDIQAQPKIVDA
jgi:hypothetical protein